MTGADMNIGIKSVVLKMTKAFMNKELAYDLSISPFILLHENGVINDDELAKITQYLQEKYKPLFVSNLSVKSLDIKVF